MFSRLLMLGLYVLTLVAAVPTQQAVISCAVGQSKSAIVLPAIDNSAPLEPGIYRILNGAAGALKATSPYGAVVASRRFEVGPTQFWRVESTAGDMYRFVNMRFTEPEHYICSGGGHNTQLILCAEQTDFDITEFAVHPAGLRGTDNVFTVKVRDEFEGLLWTAADLNVADSLIHHQIWKNKPRSGGARDISAIMMYPCERSRAPVTGTQFL